MINDSELDQYTEVGKIIIKRPHNKASLDTCSSWSYYQLKIDNCHKRIQEETKLVMEQTQSM